MNILDTALQVARPYLGAIAVAVISALALVGARKLLGSVGRTHLTQQAATLFLSAAALLAVLVALPIDPTLRGQLLGFLGVLLSAALALSSTTFLGNVLAGVMLRIMRNFHSGDFLRVEGHFGRVSDRSLLHTEIQTEERDLTTLPNMYLVTHPMTVTRNSGAIVSATVSLGYDIHHDRIEALLLEAARRAELTDAFVHVVELGDFAVTYRVAGLLADVKQLLSARSRLRTLMLDALHGGEVEIVSPTFMNTRSLGPERRFLPATLSRRLERPQPEALAEEVAFDKAEEAETLERMRLSLRKLERRIEALRTEPQGEPDREARQAKIERLEGSLERLRAAIADREALERERGSG